jgi:predicted  nucleic acid-binding Zn-ribbon protein
MSGPASILREIHRLRRHIKDLDSKIDNGPRQLKAQQNKIAKDEENVKKAQDTLKHCKVHIHEKEVAIKSTQAEIQKYEKQLGEISTKKEYDALRLEIARARDHIKKIEDEILELMLELDEKDKLVPEAEKGVQKAKDDVAQFERDLKERLARFAEDKAKASAELRHIETTLPDEIRAQYDRLVSFKGEDSIAAVAGTNCTACYTEVTPQMANDLARGVFILCKNCGRMLYAETA